MTKIELNVDNYLGFGDDGKVEHYLFINTDDEPILKQTITIESMALDFLEMRSINDRFSVHHMEEAQKLCDSLEDALALVKAAMK